MVPENSQRCLILAVNTIMILLFLRRNILCSIKDCGVCQKMSKNTHHHISIQVPGVEATPDPLVSLLLFKMFIELLHYYYMAQQWAHYNIV
jgi:hypothetical protein